MPIRPGAADPPARPDSARAISHSSSAPTTIRTAPTLVGAPPGPSAWAVPEVPKQTAARRTWARAAEASDGMTLRLFHNLPQDARNRSTSATSAASASAGGSGPNQANSGPRAPPRAHHALARPAPPA